MEKQPAPSVAEVHPLGVLVEAIPTIVWTARPDGYLDYYNQKWFEYTGATLEQTQGWGWQTLVHHEDLKDCLTQWTRSLETGAPFEVEYRLKRASDGAYRWHLDRALPTRDASGRITKWCGTRTDIHDEKEFSSANEFLARVSHELAESLDVDATLQRTTRLLVPRMADACSVYLRDTSGTQASVASAHVEPRLEVLLGQMHERYPLWASPESSGHAELMTEIPPGLLERLALSDDHLVMLRELKLVSWVRVPMVVSGQVLGMLALYSSNPSRRYRAADLALAQEVARRAATTIDNARHYESRMRAEEELRTQMERTAEERLRLLVESVKEHTICMLDTEGRFETWPSGPEALQGYSPQEMIGQHLSVLYTAEEIGLKKPQELLQRAAAQGRVETEGWRVRKDGSRFWAETILSAVRDPAGRLVGFAKVTRDLTFRREAEANRSRLASIVESSSEAIYSADADGIIQNWNAGAETLYGFCASEVIGKRGSILVPPEGIAQYEGFLETLRAGSKVQIEVTAVHKNGGSLAVSLGLSPIRDGTGRVVGASIVGRDIHLQKHAERALQASLKEKDVLLKEIHHRVKNNLQVISSLLNLQAREVQDPRALSMFRASQTRVRSIALFHEKFYQSRDLGRVDIGGYLGDLARGLMAAHGIEPEQVKIVVDAEPMSLGVDAAIPCGLIVNELATNALKHAFPGGRKGQMKITLRRLGPNVSLRIEDNGIGLPAHLANEAAPTLGMTLVRTLADQLEATLDIKVHDGTAIQLQFKAPEQELLREAA